MKRCIFPKCEERAEGIMCAHHWAMVPSEARRALFNELKAMKARGQKKPTARLREAYVLAMEATLKSELEKQAAKSEPGTP